ncbi:MAG: TolC family protein [Treponema sp.]|jgi:outer membrane protein TolC|nr:TolC family protein [Treponema sp.]
MNKKQITGILTAYVMLMFLCINLPAQEVPSQGPVRLSPDEAVELAYKNNLSLESSRIGLSTRKRASDLSWNQFIPSVTVAGAYSRDNEPSTISGITVIGGVPFPYTVDAPQWRISIPFQIQLNLNAAMFENMNRLRIDYETGRISYEKAKIQLERDVRKAYHNMLLLQENIALLRVSFANVERQVQMAQANYNAGLAPELVLLQARVARENMRPIIDQAENGLKLSMAQFAMFLGMDYDTEFEFNPISGDVAFDQFDLTEMISRASSGKPEIRELQQNIKMMNSARMAQILALTPSLSVGWNTAPTYLGDPLKDWLSPRPGSLSITLALQLHSLIPFSQNFQGIKNLDDQIRTANIGLAQLINGTEIEVYNIVLALERTRVSANAQAQTVQLAQQAYRLTEQAYQAGLQDYFQVQNAQQSLHQARVQMLEQQFNYLNGLIDLEYAIGVPFGTLSKRSVE